MILPALMISMLVQTTPTKDLLQTAQSNLLDEKWQEAATVLDELAATTPSPEIMYDRGIAYYNLGQFEIAAKAFEDAMSTSENQNLRTYSAFNLGNSVFQQTMNDLEGTGTATSSEESIKTTELAKEQIKNALQSYRTAIKEDSSDMDARANGELAWQMLKQLNQMQDQMEEQQQQSEDQQQQDGQQSEDQQQQDDQQSEDQQQQDNQQSEDQQQQDGQQSEDQQQQDGQQSEDQQQQDGQQSEDQQQQDGQQSEDQQQQDDQQSEDQQQQDGQQSKDQQQQDGQQSEDQQQQDYQQSEDQQHESKQPEQQDINEGELETIEETNSESEISQASIKEEGKRLSKDEAARLLQLIRDKEQQRRKALAAKRASRRIPVTKDW
ncbi:MAG: tetratricopeptide repeat protein [Phycisphaerales bacterium]|jgi:hypothetical protein|nr:tetratricopeptide repeat protein [Phycisphaerales bacterium]